jgi:hypothetical protein
MGLYSESFGDFGAYGEFAIRWITISRRMGVAHGVCLWRVEWNWIGGVKGKWGRITSISHGDDVGEFVRVGRVERMEGTNGTERRHVG